MNKLTKLKYQRMKVLQKLNKLSLSAKRRRERSRELLQYGLLMEKASILEEEDEILLGFLLDFKLYITEINMNDGKELLRKKNLAEERAIDYSLIEKKERAHKLISKGALVHTANLKEVKRSVLGGYFLLFKNFNSFELNRFYEIGYIALNRKKEEKYYERKKR